MLKVVPTLHLQAWLFVKCLALQCLLFNNKVHCREEERKRKAKALQQRDTHQ